MLKCDLHVHTNYSPDSSVSMQSYALCALQLGLDAICFTDHIDINSRRNTFADFRFEQRLKEFEQVKKQFRGKLVLLLGFEMAEPHLHPRETAFLRSLKPDVIIGSVHDSDALQGIADRRSYERAYDRVVRQMVEDGDFDVLGHADVLRKWHNDYVPDTEYLCGTMERCVRRGIVPEVNTSSLRNSSFTMPSLDVIDHYVRSGGSYVCVNSDAHTLAQLDEFPQVRTLLPAGAQLCCFVQGKIVTRL